MKKIDVVCTQPSHVDFPLWRYYLQKYRSHFSQIVVAMSDCHRDMDVQTFESAFLKGIGATVIPSGSNLPGHDWRSSAVNRCLLISRSERVLFLEQDFLFDHDFLDVVLKNDSPLIGFKEDAHRKGRLHPGFLLVDRSLIDQVDLQFSADPPKYDHFGKISEALELITNPVYLDDICGGWEHLAGLTHNYDLLMNGCSPNHQLQKFIEYNKNCLALDIVQHDEFLKIIEKGANAQSLQ